MTTATPIQSMNVMTATEVTTLCTLLRAGTNGSHSRVIGFLRLCVASNTDVPVHYD